MIQHGKQIKNQTSNQKNSGELCKVIKLHLD